MYYQPYYNTPVDYRQYQPMQAPLTSPDERIWVTGRGGADSYLVAPNGFVRLWDNTSNRFYEKRADATGRPSMEVYEYSKAPTEPVQTAESVTEYDARIKELEARIKALEAMYDGRNADTTAV